MQTQRDHVHAHQFQMGRMASGLVFGEPASLEPPARRVIFGMITGIVVSLVAVVGFGLYGLLFPSKSGGSQAWRQPGSILVEKETGTRFVYLDGVLRPTLNQASALLLEAGRNPHVVLVSRSALAGVPRGTPIGIPGAPQVLPPAQQLVHGPWLLCLPGHGPASGGGTAPIGIDLDPHARSAPVGPNLALIVIGPSGTEYLLWRDVKYPIADPSVIVALGMANVPPVPVPQWWLGALASGKTIGAATIPGSGRRGSAIGGTRYEIGRLFRQRAVNGTEALFVLREDGLAPLSKLEFALLAAKAGAQPPVQLSAADVVSAPRSPDRSLAGGRLPNLAGVTAVNTSGKSVCLRQRPDGGRFVNTVVLADPGETARVPQGSARVHVPPGGGMLAVAAPVPRSATRRRSYLITDQGVKYPLAGEQAGQDLGYHASAVPFPGKLLDMLPTGPSLSTTAEGLK